MTPRQGNDRLTQIERSLYDIKRILEAAPTSKTIWAATGLTAAVLIAGCALLLYASSHSLAVSRWLMAVTP